MATTLRRRPPVPPSARVAVALVLGLLVVEFHVGSAALAAEQWTHAASEHFEVYTTSHDKRAREILVYFERVHAFYADFLKLAPKTQHPTRLIVFSNAREYQPVRLNEFATAFYAPGPDRDYIVMRSFDAESYPVVVHEYAHLIARHANAVFPPWLNEGLADFFSTITPEGGLMSLGRAPLERLSDLREGGSWLGLDRMLAVTHRSPEYSSRDHAGMFYAQSWALAHMIMVSDDYRPRSDALLGRVGGGESAAAAFATTYGKTIAEVERDLQAYVRRGRFNYFKLKYRDPKIPVTFPTRPVPNHEAELVIANLLASHPDRAGQARAAYEKLGKERPDDRDILDARGLFEIQHGDENAALGFLTRAIAAGSQNPSVYRWAAAMASTPSEQEALLESALTLVPHDLSVRLAYAAALKVRGDLRGAQAALAPVTRVQPEQAFLYFELRASISLELGDHGSARASADRAKEFASPGREADHLDDLFRALDEHDARRAALDPARRPQRQPETTSAPDRAGAAAPASRLRSAITGETLTVAEGRFTQLVCTSTPAVVEVTTPGGVLRFAIDDPVKVTTQGAGEPTMSLTCGAQDRRVRVGYVPSPGDTTGTAGVLRLLELQ